MKKNYSKYVIAKSKIILLPLLATTLLFLMMSSKMSMSLTDISNFLYLCTPKVNPFTIKRDTKLSILN
jgi:hypothetical protein